MDYYPLIILLVGIVTVIGMIIALRLNAFVALITAAILVSLMSPGGLSEKISRVADAFGSAAGKIGIVIALAAIIGKCLMDSGAADKIVRSFLRLLGEKRAPEALTGASFVLAVPVFFDTVFYLMVPLARSLWKRTGKNYVLYILAIATGGVITHGMVPPTPGPLLMAANLDIDIGVMILVGALVGIPTAAVGLLAARIFNRLMDIPCRPYRSETEAELEPLPDERLPSLWLAVAPVILPVILISTNTVTRTMADAERVELLDNGNILDWPGFTMALGTEKTDRQSIPIRRVATLLPRQLQQRVSDATASGTVDAGLAGQVKTAIGERVQTHRFWDDLAFLGVTPSADARKLLDRGVDELSAEQRERLNWLTFEAAFPAYVSQTPRRQVADVTALLGNANLALLISAAIAMVVLVRQRGLTLKQLAKTTETALMSGGVIILITAGGGAFGAMLREARVGDAVEQMFSDGGQGAGTMMLLIGFGIATVMKVAQGSGTVSMITTSAMMAAMGVSAESLGFHPVYLALAIACGSQTGSWMNDSGFWIFARMSNLTELETLKTWTVQLAILGVAGMAIILVASRVLPLA